MKFLTKYNIVPINDGYTYLCLNLNGGHELYEKAGTLTSNLIELLFDDEQSAQKYIEKNLTNPENYKPEAMLINEEVYLKRQNK